MSAKRWDYQRDHRLLPKDRIEVHLRRWYYNHSCVLDVRHFGEDGPAFDSEMRLLMAAEKGMAIAYKALRCLFPALLTAHRMTQQ